MKLNTIQTYSTATKHDSKRLDKQGRKAAKILRDSRKNSRGRGVVRFINSMGE